MSLWSILVMAAGAVARHRKEDASEITVVLGSDISWRQGRVRVYLSESCDGEPRTSCSDDQDTSQVFGVDWYDETASVVINASTLGYPVWSLSELDLGKYCAQAELWPHQTFKRGDGSTVTLPTSCVSEGGGDGSYDSPLGTLYSKVVNLSATTQLELDGEVGPVESPPGCSGYGDDTEWIKTVRVQSARLSEFWGMNMTLEACVLLPYGFDDHPDAQYPLVIAHGHYSAVFAPGGRFDATPPTTQTGYDYVDQTYANYLYANWTSSDLAFQGARMLVATVNHPVPFFDDSYAVDSANVGPYGAAVIEDLIPEIERLYRGVGQGWARGVFGGSTGGWEALASQVFYPDFYNFAAVACPDPIAFSSYATLNIYDESNGYYYDAPFKKTARPGQRDSYSGQSIIPGTETPTYGHPYGQTTATIEEMNRREIVLGPKSGSCGQWDIWEAVFSPQGDDGYPQRIWCKDPALCGDNYGKIDKDVATYWKENFDLLYKMQSNWTVLKPKLDGKLHIFVGASDTFFLSNAVMDLEDWLVSLDDEGFEHEIVIGAHNGRGYEHCFNGFAPDGSLAPNSITRELYLQKFLPQMAQRFVATAPDGANLEWSTY